VHEISISSIQYITSCRKRFPSLLILVKQSSTYCILCNFSRRGEGEGDQSRKVEKERKFEIFSDAVALPQTVTSKIKSLYT
jgi:hypothetical protein